MIRRLRGAITEDDHSGFGRPTRNTRPRTKDRPDYSKAEIALVVTVDRGRFRCLIPGTINREISATKARTLGRTGVIVGDRVRLVGDTSSTEGTLARIVEVIPRETVLRRTADDDDPYERPIVANADQLVIVTALADPPPRTGMIDRMLVAAYDARLEPVLCLTKQDLASPAALLAAYTPLNVPIVTIQPGSDLSALRELLANRTSVLVGHSGVGKSTLVNALIPGMDRATGDVNEVTGRGRHTSSSAILLPLPEPGGWVIDTPGVRSFGLSHVTQESIVAAFPDFVDFAQDCPRGCQHDSSAPECGFDAAVAAGKLAPERLDSFRRMGRAWATPHG
ncbi:MAG: ribosome small subunit-dependent GTPase A [Micropruina sp.]|nr:ribosome small subunit-dependent GTPase A [Micropruina sp.]